jgi:hypothetical protein
MLARADMRAHSGPSPRRRACSAWPALHLMASLILLVAGPVPVGAEGLAVPRVNAPYQAPGSEAAVFWFGRVTLQENYADVRMGYGDNHLYVHVNIVDRRLWYDTSPSSGDLTDWDAVSVYLNASCETPPPLEGSYRFDGQLVWYEDRDDYQASYRYSSGSWSSASVLFTTESSWSGDVPNTNVDDRGWTLLYYLPFPSLGLSGPPAQGTTWRIALVLHDRDDAGGPPLGKQVWPTAMSATNPSTWAELYFGTPPAYEPPPASPGGLVSIRHGESGAIVPDADVGGSSTCGAPAGPDFFPTWGSLNWAGKEFLNVQNLGHISEWPCFSKYYVTFPLDAIPTGKEILSAQLTLYQNGSAGADKTPTPTPSLIQVSTTSLPWQESTITWNNAPPATENVATTWVPPLDEAPPWPGIPREWDVSGAVAEAYASGDPVRLAIYSPAWDYHSGRYFFSSDISGIDGRPTLTVTWGEPIAQIVKEADKAGADQGEAVTYMLRFAGTGDALTLTDTLPSGITWVGDLGISDPHPLPVYDADQQRITWQGSPATGEQVRITYSVMVSTGALERLVNQAELKDAQGGVSAAIVTVLANPHRFFLACVMR